MNQNERSRFMDLLGSIKDDAILIDDVIAEMDKLAEWKRKYPPLSIERAYVSAHESALHNLVKRKHT